MRNLQASVLRVLMQQKFLNIRYFWAVTEACVRRRLLEEQIEHAIEAHRWYMVCALQAQVRRALLNHRMLQFHAQIIVAAVRRLRDRKHFTNKTDARTIVAAVSQALTDPLVERKGPNRSPEPGLHPVPPSTRREKQHKRRGSAPVKPSENAATAASFGPFDQPGADSSARDIQRWVRSYLGRRAGHKLMFTLMQEQERALMEISTSEYGDSGSAKRSPRRMIRESTFLADSKPRREGPESISPRYRWKPTLQTTLQHSANTQTIRSSGVKTREVFSFFFFDLVHCGCFSTWRRT